MIQSRMKQNLLYAMMAFAAMTVLNSCDEDDLSKVYDEKTSLDSPFLFSEDYQDSIVVAYDLPVPTTDWLSMVKDETKVCKIRQELRHQRCAVVAEGLAQLTGTCSLQDILIN